MSFTHARGMLSAVARPKVLSAEELKKQAEKRLNRLKKDWQMIQTGKASETYYIVRPRKPDDLTYWDVFIAGPPRTPYAGGEFQCLFKVPEDYPNSPPRVVWITPVVHLNINPGEVDPISGDIEKVGYVCLDVIKSRWSPAILLGNLPAYLQQLLESPAFDDPIGNDAYKIYKAKGVKAYEQEAIKLTAMHAPLKEFKGKTPYPNAFAAASATSSSTTSTSDVKRDCVMID